MKSARSASYWRWVALAGSRKARSTSVSSLASPLNTPPLSQLAPARPAPRTACRQSYLHRCDSRRAGLGRANQLTLWEMVHRFDRELTSAGRPHEASPARSTVALARYPYVGIQASAGDERDRRGRPGRQEADGRGVRSRLEGAGASGRSGAAPGIWAWRWTGQLIVRPATASPA